MWKIPISSVSGKCKYCGAAYFYQGCDWQTINSAMEDFMTTHDDCQPEVDEPTVGMCTRDAWHTGPCNGFPSSTCFDHPHRDNQDGTGICLDCGKAHSTIVY